MDKKGEEKKSFLEWFKRPNSLKRKLLIFMVLCWGVPILVFFTFTTISYRDGIVEKAEGIMEDEIEGEDYFESISIDDAI